jgi:hypothetical protein
MNVEEELAALSPVLVPETDTAPAPMVRTDVLPEFAVKVSVPVLTVRAVVSVALVTAPAVKEEAVPVKFVATPEEGVPRAPPFSKTFTPSTETTPAETLAMVVSDAAPSSREPTPSAVDVDEVRPEIGRPVALVSVPEEGVPSAPPEYITVPPAPKAIVEASVPLNVRELERERALPEVATSPRYALFQ